MDLKNSKRLFNINYRDVVSIVGAGGKTSLMFYLASILDGRVVIATSTKIRIPTDGYRQYVNQIIQWQESSEVVVAAETKSNGKLIGYSPYINNSSYDYLIIEADGSRGLPLKGWGINEPVITEKTSKTIGVIDITTLGMTIGDETVFRIDELSKITSLGSHITLDNLCDIVQHENGLFKNSKGRRIVFVNKVEDEHSWMAARELCHKLTKNVVDQVIIGSVNNQVFESVRVDG